VTKLLASLPNPDDAVHFLNRLTLEAPDAARWITEDAAALRYALTVFSFSHFLADSVIRFPGWLIEIARAGDLHRGFLAEQYEELLTRSLPADGVPRPVDLALFRRKQLLRILLRDVLQFADVSETTEDLSNLADAIVNATWQAVRRQLTREPGAPAGAEFSVIALGKLGGRELNYSSDIDLMFVYSGAAAAADQFFKAAANRMTDMLSAYTEEGSCYRVDLRLRPDGRFGEVCHSLEGAKHYYASRGRDWELQMLIKARVAAGDPRPGRELLEFVEPLIYRTTTDFRTIEAVSETRARIHEKLRLDKQRQAAPSGADVKLAKGGIRDIEFLVQCLQRLHGGREPWVRHGGTLLALSRLRDKELLSPLEYARLASAYQFMRHLEHRLQFDEDRQTHTLPETKDQLDLLARKMPASGLPSAGTLERELDHHFSSVQDLYERVIHSQLAVVVPIPDVVPVPDVVPHSDAVPNADAIEAEDAEDIPNPEAAGVLEETRPARAEFPSANLRRFLDQRAPAFAQVIAESGISRAAIALTGESFESFIEKVVADTARLEMFENNSELTRCTVDLFEHSQYFSDQLVSHPELIEEVRAACGERQGRTGFQAPRDPDGLRRFFRRQMVRIQSDSVYHRVPVFRTLKRTSELAESIINAAYEMAIDEPAVARSGVPPSSLTYAPSNQMMVIALGRLGMLEFDLASDADLVFVIPDSDAHETLFWTGVAERMISVISAYTGDGVVFTIDTRLRPNGREGALVQTESSYKDYFAHHAEAWEGISYMKARAVAGNIARATEFLGELQEIDWRLYGQNGRSRSELAQMRTRLEREQGSRNPLKAAAGGYYDIDFALMYLRLKSAGVFFKVLNTPERIDIVEKMGHLDREDARFLRDAAIFYRAADHGLRVLTGHAEGRLPTNRAHIAILTDLVHRWTPENLHEGSLNSVSKRIRRETRAFFERLFGRP